jgi:hypothetical protein
MLELTQNYKSVLDRTIEIPNSKASENSKFIVPKALSRLGKPSSRTINDVKTERQIKSRSKLNTVLKTTESRMTTGRNGL